MTKIKKALNESSLARWGVLLIVSFVIAASYYFYDALSSIKSLMQNELKLSNTDYGLIVSFYAFPNVFLLLTIFGGMILDKWGIRKTGIIFIGFTAIGALITAYGASDIYRTGGFAYGAMQSFLPNYSPELKMMILGRLFFGLGAETSIIVINKIIVKWFKGKQLAFAFAVNIAIARIGTAAALILSPIFVNSESGWTTAVWLAAILVAISLVAFIIYTMYDAKFDKQNIKTEDQDEEQFRFSDVFLLFKNQSFVYISLLCVTFYSAVFPFLAYAPDLFHNKFGFSEANSGLMASILPFGTILFTPLFGAFVDKKGKSASLMIYGSILLILVHLTLSFTNITPYISVFILGIAFSLVPAAMWPAVAKIVDESRVGTAYGVMTSIQNIGLFLFPILAGIVLDSNNPYIYEKTFDIKNVLQISDTEKYIQINDKINNIAEFKSSNQTLNFSVSIINNGEKIKQIWNDSYRFKTDSDGNFDFKIGAIDDTLTSKGSLMDFRGIKWNSDNYKFEIKSRPALDYSYTILMFALLGILGLFFAIMLKRTDKKTGYGIESPLNEHHD